MRNQTVTAFSLQKHKNLSIFSTRFFALIAISKDRGLRFRRAPKKSIAARSIAVKHRKKKSEPTSPESEIAELIERIVATPGGDELLERIFAVLSDGEREILWAYLLQTDAQELGYELGIVKQSAQNQLVLIKEKLGFDSRPELFRQVFAALLGKLKKK